MKIPTTFVLKGKRWRVLFRRRVLLDGEECLGLCCTDSRRIFVQKGLSKKIEAQTFLHEFGHALLHEIHCILPDDVEETIVDGISAGILEVFTVHPR